MSMHIRLIEAMLSTETSHQLHTYMNDKIASVVGTTSAEVYV